VSEWNNNEVVASAFEALHGIKPELSVRRLDKQNIQSKLTLGDKVVILTERLERGLTKEAIMEYNGEKFSFKRVIDAERAAAAIIDSGVKPIIKEIDASNVR